MDTNNTKKKTKDDEVMESELTEQELEDIVAGGGDGPIQNRLINEL